MNEGRLQLVKRSWPAIGVALALLILPGCHQDMYDQPHHEPLEASTVFADGQASRPRVPGTVAQGHLELDDAYFTGRSDGQLVTEIPVRVTTRLLNRGRERFNIYCSVCHGRAGDGQGMIVERGFRRPPSYHSPQLRGRPVGHFFDVMTNGFGVMPDYAEQVPPEDRWAIAAYIRALQLSQHAKVSELPKAERSIVQGE